MAARFYDGIMKAVVFMTAGMLMPGIVPGAERSGQAEVELVSAAEGYTAGHPVMLGVRMRIDEGWHTYWTNPGEGGMALAVSWKLPEGWEAGPVLHPVPKSFKTGELPGFGYEGEVILPVFVTPPADAAGDVTLAVELDWLTCDDSTCVAGEATAAIKLRHGLGDPTPAAKDIEAAFDKVPQPVDGATLNVVEDGEWLQLTVDLPAEIDAAGASWLPATPSVVDLAEEIRPVLDGGKWQARVRRHEYATGPVEGLELVLAGGGLDAPLQLVWKKPG